MSEKKELNSYDSFFAIFVGPAQVIFVISAVKAVGNSASEVKVWRLI